MALIDTLLTLLAPAGPSGFEGAIAQVIEQELAPFADEIRTDVMGNLIAIKHGPGKRILCAAHMDEIGFMITHIDDKGFLRVATVGGINVVASVSRQVVLRSGCSGVLYQEQEREDNAPLAAGHLFIDIGASSREEAEAHAQVGDWAVYAPQVSRMGNRIASPYMDDRAGCAILLEAFKALDKPANEVIAVFTTQEELGLRGAHVAAYEADPQIGIALDVTLAGDTPKAIRQTCSLGDGIAVKVMDRSLVCHPAVRAWMESTAKAKGIPFQREIITAGGTDAGAIQVTRSGVAAGVLSIPCRYVHSPAETIDLRDLEGGVRLLTSLLQEEAKLA